MNALNHQKRVSATAGGPASEQSISVWMRARGLKPLERELDAKAEGVERTSWLQGLEWPDAQLLGRYLSAYHARAGATIFEEGDEAFFMCFIVKGRVSIVKNGVQEHALSQLKAGRSFGEMGLLDNEPRSAGARTLQETELLVLTGCDFAALAGSNPSITSFIYERIAKLLSQRLRNTSGTLVELLGAQKAAV